MNRLVATAVAVLMCSTTSALCSDILSVWSFSLPRRGLIPKPGTHLAGVNLTLRVTLADVIDDGQVRLRIVELDDGGDDRLLELKIAHGGPYAYGDTVDVRMFVEFKCSPSCALDITRVSSVEIAPLGSSLVTCPPGSYVADIFANPGIEHIYLVALQDFGDNDYHGMRGVACVPPRPKKVKVVRTKWPALPGTPKPMVYDESTSWGAVKALYR